MSLTTRVKQLEKNTPQQDAGYLLVHQTEEYLAVCYKGECHHLTDEEEMRERWPHQPVIYFTGNINPEDV